MVSKKDLLHKIELIEKELQSIKQIDWKMEVEKVKTHLVSLRALVNRKLGGSLNNENDIKDPYEPLR